MYQWQIKKQHPTWQVVAYCQDMKAVINCASCGQRCVYGTESYTSMRHFTDDGVWGLSVCDMCYQKEIEQERKLWQR